LLLTVQYIAIHDLNFENNVFHMETATKQGMPFSAAMHYGSSKDDKPGNASSTPHVYGVYLRIPGCVWMPEVISAVDH